MSFWTIINALSVGCALGATAIALWERKSEVAFWAFIAFTYALAGALK